ncbi:ABC transporter substrate-binding protein [Sphingomonas changnyeongensis]|uniref:ABC transporter substrate-binding protein n=1 Tax=Sphingomonas changnyeongensis TaxID=2698679 RepID=A0A7Z2NYP6_9SPHN|nr:ABC transporter substrate-binding protein [Sphingomonas changnyeongensis]
MVLPGLTACEAGSGAWSSAAPRPPAVPLRVVSLDYCADQYVLALVPRNRIAALSPDARKSFSYHRARAAGIAQVPSRAEDVLVRRPDLVVRSYGGGPDAARFFARSGVPVVQIGYANDLAGVRRTLIEVADGLGASARGAALARAMDARLARLRGDRPARQALYMTPAGVTTGSGTLIHAMITAAGLANFMDAPGWRPLPLERLAYQRPDLVAAAFFGTETDHRDGWSAARHPVARAQLRERPVVNLDGASTACGGWFVLDAVEALARGAE